MLGDDVSRLGGTFTSTDSRFNASTGIFTTTIANTTTPEQRILEFTYTSPTWDELMDRDGSYTGATYNYLSGDGNNGLDIFWPTIATRVSPALTSTQSSVPLGLLAQEYSIVSMDVPPIDEVGEYGCIGCVSRFNIGTYGAPYAGTVTLSSDQSGQFSIGAYEYADTVDVQFNLSGMGQVFRYRPNVTGLHTISGTSNSPAIRDTSLAFQVNASPFILICEGNTIRRGSTVSCTLDTSYGDGPNNTDPFYDITLSDLFSGADPGDETPGDGIFTDTTDDGTFNPTTKTYRFCNKNYPTANANPCTGETNERAFTYTLPLDTEDRHGVVGITATNHGTDPSDINRTWLSIVPTKMDFYCPALSPNCDKTYPGLIQNYALNPNGMFAGTVSLSDGSDGSFSDDGEVTWNYSSGEFMFTYSPASTGIKTLTATVTAVDNPTASDIHVGDTYTMTVVVQADKLSFAGPGLIVKYTDGTDPGDNHYTLNLNGPYTGTVKFGTWVRSGDDDIFVDSIEFANMADGMVAGGDGTFSCTVSLLDYDATHNTTQACSFWTNNSTVPPINYLEGRTISTDPMVANGNIRVGIVANNFTVQRAGSDATTAPIVLSTSETLDFTLTPNGLFAGEYSLSDGGKGGTFSPTSGSIALSQESWPAANDQTMQSRTFTYTPPSTPGRYLISVDAARSDTALPAGLANLPTKTIEVLVLADCIKIDPGDHGHLHTGEDSEIKVVINGPYAGTAEASVYLPEGDTKLPLPGDILLADHICDFTLADYDITTNTTSCTFKITIPYGHAVNYLGIEVEAPGLTADPIVAVAADTFTLTGDTNATAGEPITFTLRPDNLWEGTFYLDDGGAGGSFSPSEVYFNSFYTDTTTQALPEGVTVTYTPSKQHSGPVTITVNAVTLDDHHHLGTQTLVLDVTGALSPDTGEVSESGDANGVALAEWAIITGVVTLIGAALATTAIRRRA
jgi:hypothetical protein